MLLQNQLFGYQIASVEFIVISFSAGTSAVVERLFSLINNYWTDDKSRLTVDTVKSWLAIKHNCKMTCEEFHKFK